MSKALSDSMAFLTPSPSSLPPFFFIASSAARAKIFVPL